MRIPAQRAGQLGLMGGGPDTDGCQPVLTGIKQLQGTLDEFDLPLTPVPDGPFGPERLGLHLVIADIGENGALFIQERVHNASRLQPRDKTQSPLPGMHAHQLQEGFGDPIGSFPERFAEFRPLVRG